MMGSVSSTLWSVRIWRRRRPELDGGKACHFVARRGSFGAASRGGAGFGESRFGMAGSAWQSRPGASCLGESGCAAVRCGLAGVA